MHLQGIHLSFHLTQTDCEPAAVMSAALSRDTHCWVVRLQNCEAAQDRAWCHCWGSHQQQRVRDTEVPTVTPEAEGAAAGLSDWALVPEQALIS